MSKFILLAEDSSDDEILFRRMMNSLGVMNPVHVVRDGKEVMAYLAGEGAFANRENFPLPAALFLDLKMPGADGWAVLKWLQGQPQLADLLVVVLTAFGDHDQLREAYQLGANSFLFKPLKANEMLDILHHWPDIWMLKQNNALRNYPASKLPGMGKKQTGSTLDAAV